MKRTISASLSTMTSLPSCARYPSGGTPPIHIPFRFEAAILSRMRSPMTSRSNCAKDNRMLRVRRPIEVVVLNCCVTETKDAPRWTMRNSGGHGPRRKERVRCAIYTRKSSEDGLEQEFNSLQAQREACEAFITSQRHEGWACVATRYDDGGFSGATMDRPALQRLLGDTAAGRVDTIVVYKIDRLTRSLADFAKIVEILDARNAWFVSVTQQFNTTTSMGRLT